MYTLLNIIFTNLCCICQSTLAKIQKFNNILSWSGCGKTGIFVTQNVTNPLKGNWAMSNRTTYAFICWPSNPTLDWDTSDNIKYICMKLFIVTWFIIAKYWILNKGPNIGEWLNKWWYIHMTQCYAGKRKKRKSKIYMNWYGEFFRIDH